MIQTKHDNTMKNQHTPGPWEADIRIAQAMVTDSNGNAIADIARHEFSDTEQSYSDQKIEANARLIAAAPDLLSALIALEKASRKVLDTSATPDGLKNCKILVEARMAIEQAGGEWK